MHFTFETFIRLFGVSAIRYFVIAGVPFMLVYKILTSWFSKSKIQKKEANIKDFEREILHSMQTTAVLVIVGYIAFFTPFKNHSQIYTNINAYPIWWIGVSLILSLIIHDTYFYWMHRLLHHKKLFKLTHLVHHQSTNPSPWASYSFHFIEAWTEGAVLFVIALLIPVHPLTIIVFTIIGFMINVYGHLGFEVAPRWFRHTVLFEFINTSVHHNMHHSKFKGNYGLYFRVWDRMMATEHPDYVQDYDRVQQNRFDDTTTHSHKLYQFKRNVRLGVKHHN
ncbi:sterol desaturase family protein [Mucilaginibacter terrae]|uniref:sterol desaturase family protein n=1 Tax=Mucilaginibacter terrae TaxID=1955052 RepID=UPI003642A557